MKGCSLKCKISFVIHNLKDMKKYFVNPVINMEDPLQGIFANRAIKDELISNINAFPDQFQATIKVALSDKQPQAWRATWILGHCVMKNDPRIRDHITAFINALNKRKDGHQREILKILEKMDLKDDQEGHLFNECMNIWESIGKSPSVRITAFRILVKISKNYPELNHEIEFLTQDRYTETLSPGVKHSFEKIWAEDDKL